MESAADKWNAWLTGELESIGADPDAMAPYLTSILRESDDDEIQAACEDCIEILTGCVEDEESLNGLTERISAAWKELVDDEKIEAKESREAEEAARKERAAEQARLAKEEAEARAASGEGTVKVSAEAEELRRCRH